MFDRALKVVRQYHRFSQTDLADRLGISRSYINEIEKGKKEPSFEVLKKYAESFSIPLSSLMLFAERSEKRDFDGARVFAADKVLKMLEWLADGVDDEEPTKGKSVRTENPVKSVSFVRN